MSDNEILENICNELRSAIEFAEELKKPIGDEVYRLAMQEKLSAHVEKAQSLIDASDFRVRALPYCDPNPFSDSYYG